MSQPSTPSAFCFWPTRCCLETTLCSGPRCATYWPAVGAAPSRAVPLASRRNGALCPTHATLNRALHIPSIAPLQRAAEAAVIRSLQPPRRVVARPQSVAADRAAFRGDVSADTARPPCQPLRSCCAVLGLNACPGPEACHAGASDPSTAVGTSLAHTALPSI
jgi:hypothetical protein